MTKIINYVLGVLLAVALGMCWLQYARAGKAEIRAAKATEQATHYRTLAEATERSLRAEKALRKAEAEGLAARAKQAQADAAFYKDKSNAVQAALKDNPDWAGAAVPDSVRRALAQGR